MRYLYSALLYCLTPLAVLRLLWRSRRAPAYRKRFRERLGWYPSTGAVAGPGIWVHAVSVGEVAAVAPLIEGLLRDFPAYRLIITTTTPTGSARVQALFGDRVTHVYCPWDLPGAVRRFLARQRPELLLLVETELWPNLLHYSRACGCRTVLVNARLSQRSARRYALAGPFSRWLLTQLDTLLCQTEADSERFLTLGARAESVLVSGNLKWECELDASTRSRGEQLRTRFGLNGSPVLLAASTHPGEEALVLDAWERVRQSHPDCRLVLVPRHPERAAEVASLCADRGQRVARLSQGGAGSADTAVLLVDTIGDLPALYAVATVAFIGGSLVAIGGHNPVEAALWRVPIVTGPHLFNFQDMAATLQDAGAMCVVQGGPELAGVLAKLIADPGRRQAMGVAANALLEVNRGALGRVTAVIAGQLGAAPR